MTLQIRSLLALLLISFMFVSCNSDNGMSDDATTSSASSTNSISTVAPATSNSTPVNQASGTVVHPPTKLGNLMNMSAPLGLAASSSGYNPAHGQPGHNCDLPVGAPLGGAVAPKPVSASPVTSENALNNILPAAPASKPNVKLNPAHGKPGHDCAVAVGAPLDGSGVKTTPSSLTTSTATPEVKINPEHGKPGHDCAVAVGAPLPSK